MRAIETVAERLGNTHPAVIDAYLDGTMLAALRARTPAAQPGAVTRNAVLGWRT